MFSYLKIENFRGIKKITVHKIILKNSFVLIIICLLTACSLNNITDKPQYQQYFADNNAMGSFAIFDNATGQFFIYNLKRFSDSAYLPASTFKIMNGLIALETGIVQNQNQVFKWDKKIRLYPFGDTAFAWNKDLTFKEAFQSSAVHIFQQIAANIGNEKMQFWLDSCKYGNKKIGNDITRFWLNNDLLITADEQLGFIKRLYFAKLPFQKRSQDIMKKCFIEEENKNIKMFYKTGFGYNKNEQSIGWVVGWIEAFNHPYFFVLNVESNKTANIPIIRKKILDNILKDFFKL